MKYKKTKSGTEYVSFGEWKRASLRDPKLARAYEALQPKYDLIRAILDARIKKGLTQEDIAQRAGTTQSAIARFESGMGNPTLDFLSRVSIAVGARLEVRTSR